MPRGGPRRGSRDPAHAIRPDGSCTCGDTAGPTANIHAQRRRRSKHLADIRMQAAES